MQPNTEIESCIIETLFELPEQKSEDKKIVIPNNSTFKFEDETATKELTIPSDIKDIRIDKYNSKNILQPKSEADKNKYMNIYIEYISNKCTEIDLAKKYDYSIVHISRIIKWAAFQMGEQDPSTDLRALVDSISLRIKHIQNEIDTSKDIEAKTKLWNVQLKCERLKSQLQGLVSSALIDMSNNSKTVNVQMNPELNRRSGSGLQGGADNADDKLIEAAATIEPEEPLSEDLERRSGLDESDEDEIDDEDFDDEEEQE